MHNLKHPGIHVSLVQTAINDGRLYKNCQHNFLNHLHPRSIFKNYSLQNTLLQRFLEQFRFRSRMSNLNRSNFRISQRYPQHRFRNQHHKNIQNSQGPKTYQKG